MPQQSGTGGFSSASAGGDVTYGRLKLSDLQLTSFVALVDGVTESCDPGMPSW